MKRSLQFIAIALLSIVAVSCSEDLPLGENYGSSEVTSRQATPSTLTEKSAESNEKSASPVIVTIFEEPEVVADTVRCVIRR